MPSILISRGERHEICINFWENEISVTEELSPVCKQKIECHNLLGYAECEEYGGHHGKPCMEV